MIPGSANALLLASAAEGGYQISRSLRFNSSDSAYLSRTPASASNRKTWTWAAWVKRSSLTAVEEHLWLAGVGQTGDTTYQRIYFDSSNKLRVSAYSYHFRITTQVFRDFSAWFHLVVAVDTTQATANNRVRVYVNGVEVTAFDTINNPAQNADTGTNSTALHYIGAEAGPIRLFNGYLADVHLIDGQQLTPSSFTEVSATTGQLVPIAYTGSYGTNGFHLPFSDNSTAAALGTDTSGNSNTWTVNNISVTAGAGNDSLVDTPTNGSQTDTGVGGEVVGNYATWNPLTVINTVGPGTLSNGNLDVSISGAKYTVTTMLIRPDTGSYYWEVNSNGGFVAIYDLSNANTIAFSSYVQTQLNGLVGVALNSDTGAYTIYLNGSVSSSGTLSDPAFAWAPAVTGNGYAFTLNAGQRPFAHTAPSGYKALCTTNLPAPVVAQPSTVMDVKLYTGNGSTQTISGLGFSPDFVWIKSRSDAFVHYLLDTVRGVQLRLSSNNTNAEASSNSITAFNSDGFSLGNEQSVNQSSSTYVAWTWDAGSTTASNPDGSITSTVRANPSAGFSVVTFTSPTGTGNFSVGHGLGVTPEFVIVKSRDAVGVWYVYHKSLATDYYLRLNGTDAAATNGVQWGAGMTSSVIGLRAGYSTVGGATTVAYAWTPVDGYSSFGSYTGNGSATDGPFVYTGFRPRWVMIKRTDAAGENWWIKDAVRSSYNVMAETLFPSSSDAEISNQSARYFDFTSNGFKLRGNDTGSNASGGTYIYAAFAESPFQYARAR